MAESTARELAILAFERQRWNHAGTKASAIRDTFECSETRYYQELNELLNRSESLPARSPGVQPAGPTPHCATPRSDPVCP